jgi:hypothetical protein
MSACWCEADIAAAQVHVRYVERIHDQVPDAPVLPKVDWRKRLAHAVSEVSAHTC